jgi:hypothetical protein
VSEKVVQQQVVSTLRSLGAAVYVLGTRRPSGDYQGTRQTPGIPDVLAFVPCAARSTIEQIWVECKAPGGRPTREQLEFRARCAQAGIAHIMGGLEELTAWLIERGIVRAERVPYYRLPREARS